MAQGWESWAQGLSEDISGSLGETLRLLGIPEVSAGPVVVTVVAACLSVLVVGLVVWLSGKALAAAVRHQRLAALDKRYHGAVCAVPRACKIRRGRKGQGAGIDLSFPYWRHSRSDGTRDRRYADNVVIWPESHLYVDEFDIVDRDPVELMSLCRTLRLAGAKIPPCDIELDKGRCLVEKARTLEAASDASELAWWFQDDPYGFEGFCAQLLEALGYRTEVTSKSGDGGFDVAFVDPQGMSGIAECKCFAQSTHVGRPLLQKLVGANQTVRAQRMVFLTTSSYTGEALRYGAEVGVECVDGDDLVAMTAAAFGTTPRHVGFNDVQWQATEDDLLAYYPADIA